MSEPRFYAANASARIQLRALWNSNDAESAEEFLRSALPLATSKLNMTVEQVPAIPGGALVAGVMDRIQRKIVISTRFPIECQRFTLAHEIGHYLLHPGTKYFRDRSMDAPDYENGRPYYEVEADVFAAEFLMPRRFLKAKFIENFGGPLDTGILERKMLDLIAKGFKNGLSQAEFLRVPQLDRARIVATTGEFCGVIFTPLYREFQVSKTAMAIQLLDCGLVN